MEEHRISYRISRSSLYDFIWSDYDLLTYCFHEESIRRSKPGWSVISRGFDFKIYGICSKNADPIFLKWPWTQYNGMTEVLQGMRLNTWVSSWNHVAVITSESSGHIPGIPIQCMVFVLAHFCQNAGYREQKPPFIRCHGNPTFVF